MAQAERLARAEDAGHPREGGDLIQAGKEYLLPPERDPRLREDDNINGNETRNLTPTKRTIK